ncbi:cell division protein FtsL, partial [Nitrospirillum viridazoti]
MIGKSTLVWLCLATVASGILYHTSYRVQEEQEHLASLNRQIAQEQQSIQVLRAEWA